MIMMKIIRIIIMVIWIMRGPYVHKMKIPGQIEALQTFNASEIIVEVRSDISVMMIPNHVWSCKNYAGNTYGIVKVNVVFVFSQCHIC